MVAPGRRGSRSCSSVNTSRMAVASLVPGGGQVGTERAQPQAAALGAQPLARSAPLAPRAQHRCWLGHNLILATAQNPSQPPILQQAPSPGPTPLSCCPGVTNCPSAIIPPSHCYLPLQCRDPPLNCPHSPVPPALLISCAQNLTVTRTARQYAGDTTSNRMDEMPHCAAFCTCRGWGAGEENAQGQEPVPGSPGLALPRHGRDQT